jgi:tight adherence protein C
MDTASLVGAAALFAGMSVFFGLVALFAPVDMLSIRRSQPDAVDSDYQDSQVDYVPTDVLGRYARPILRNFMPVLPRNMLSTPARQRLEKLIRQAGNPWRLTPDEFVAIRIALSLILFVGGIIGGVLGLITIPGVPVIVEILALAGVGYLVPRQVYVSAKEARTKSLLKDLPEALDLMVVTLDSGQTLEPTIRSVTPQLNEGVLRSEFSRINTELAAGSTLERSLTALYRNVDSIEAEAFAKAVIQSSQLGASASDTLRRQAQFARDNYEGRIATMIARLANTMIIPLMATMMPAFLIVVLAPQLSAFTRFF